MKVLLLTVAGLSSRFSSSVGREVVKCIYHEGDFSDSLISRMLKHESYFDKIVIVDGFRHSEIEEQIKEHYNSIIDKIQFATNPFFKEYGSGYSFYLGFEALSDMEVDELIFAEGDLFVDDESFYQVIGSRSNVITYSFDPILSNKSVAFYIDKSDAIHYIFDTAHSMLSINEPFRAIYNSGQIWKFTDTKLLRDVYSRLSSEEIQGTNLVPINTYFNCLDESKYEIIGLKQWINCNTVEDYRESLR